MSKFDHIEEVNKNIDHIEHVEKFNPYHDKWGRFTSSGTAFHMTVRTRDPKKQHMADMAIARAKEAQEGEKKVSAAEDRLIGMLPAGAYVYLGGCDPELAVGVADSVEMVLNKYPNAKNAVKGVAAMTTLDMKRENAMAAFDVGSGRIFLNADYYGNKKEFETKYKASLDKKFHPEGTGVDSVVVHEIGHALDHYVSVEVIGQQKVYWERDTISTRLWNNEIKAAKKRAHH